LELQEEKRENKGKKQRCHKKKGIKLYKVDNLYIDLNAMIHPCCIPYVGATPVNESEMMLNLFEYLDWIIDTVRPRKLIYFAIDGVCPRAKMNQQRGRRFSSAKDRAKLIRSGKLGLWDRNQITPGTEFMELVSEALTYYIKRRVSTDMEHVRMIFSDSHCPGEGEHKIMSFIRHLRHDPKYDPSTRHVLYGADADLIFLALAVHEPNFSIIREIPEDRKKEKSASLTEQELTVVNIGTLRKHLYRKFEKLKDIPCG
jgi:5'-3' exoribonuclease 2